MTFTEFIPLTAGLVNLVLTLFVVAQGLRSNTIRVYAFWGLALTIWNLGTFYMFRVDNREEALFWARFLQYGVIFLPITLAHLCYLIGHLPVSRFIHLGYLLHAGLAVTNLTDFFIADVRTVGYAYYAVAGPGFWVLVLTYSIPALAVYHLSQKVQSLSPLHQRRVWGMIAAVVALIVFGFNDSLPILGMEKYPVLGTDIFPFGSAAAIFYGIIVGYGVLQHHLLDIHVTLSRLAARAVRFLFVFLFGLSLLLLLTVFAPGQFNTFTFFGALGVLMISAVAASIFFPRLFGSGDEKIERRILGDRFEYHDRLRGFIQSMQWFTDSNEMLDSLHTLLTQTVRARSYQIFVQDEKTGVFSLFRAFPPLSNGRVPKLHGGSAICRLFEVGKVPYLGFREGSAGVGDAELEQAAWEQVKPFGADYCFVLLTDENPFGLFLIGPKASAEPYTLHDLELLTELVTNLSLHLNQMRLKKQILLAQEMDLLGMMSRGMAHDLNNLITPVWTFLQLAREKARPEEGHNELLPTVSRNVETMMAYIRESLFFSDTQTPHLNIASLPGTVRQAVELARPRAAVKGIQLVCADMPEAEVEVDTVMIQRLVNNLLANAIDASPERAQITVQISRLETTDTSREWYRIEVVDQGEGISRENLKQVLMPYFTTKDRGDERRGFGLGLAICRKVVHLHGGNLNILSEEGRGTTVQVDLPSRQMPVNGEAARA